MIDDQQKKRPWTERLLGGGRGGAGGIVPLALVGAPGGAEEIDEVELFGEPEGKMKVTLNDCLSSDRCAFRPGA